MPLHRPVAHHARLAIATSRRTSAAGGGGDRVRCIAVLLDYAGLVERVTLVELADDTFEREVDVIAGATYLCSQAVYELRKPQGGGKIVNISSSSGMLGVAVPRPP